MTSQVIRGNKSVQVQNVSQSSINITYNEVRRAVPLERATVPVSSRTSSPARLVRARSGVVPYAAREDFLDGLDDWVNGEAAFAGAVIGGRGGAGKTRTAVALCERVEARDWLCGFLTPIADQAALEGLSEAPTARLVVVDYAEARLEQLQVLLPVLAARATPESPVRVLLLVRANPQRTSDWTERLRNRSDWLDALLDECDLHVLEELPLEMDERETLFKAAAAALGERIGAAVGPAVPEVLREPTFASPLLVVLAAYLAVHGNSAPPSSRAALLDEILAHERRHWRASAPGLFADDVLPQRVVALATLGGAGDEAEAVERLRLLPDLDDASGERLALLARWAHEQYPGPAWWNPLEPDMVGEHLIAESFAGLPSVLAGVLAAPSPRGITRPLEVYARAAADHPRLAAALQPIVSRELAHLCELAVSQAASEADHDLLYGNVTTAATAIERTVNALDLESAAITTALETMPPHTNLILDSLVLTLNLREVAQLRRLAAADPAAFGGGLATSLNNLSSRLATTGRSEEGLAAIEESVEINRRLAADDPRRQPNLGMSLNNLSNRLVELGRLWEGLAAVEESVEINRRLAADEGGDESGLATSLNNLSVYLSGVGRQSAALPAIEECIEVRRRLAAQDPVAYEPELAGSLSNLSIRLHEADRRDEGLPAIEECVEIYRRLAAANPAAFESELAKSLNNLSIYLADLDRAEEGLTAIEESVEVRRRLAAVNPEAYESSLALSLNNLSARLSAAGRNEEGLAAIEESVAMRRALAAKNPAAHGPELANSLHNLSLHLAAMDRDREALAVVEECIGVRRRLAAENPAAHGSDLALSLESLGRRLVKLERREEAERAMAEAGTIRAADR
jgi:hypothetical protein